MLFEPPDVHKVSAADGSQKVLEQPINESVKELVFMKHHEGLT